MFLAPRASYLFGLFWLVSIYLTDELMNKNDTQKLVIFVAALCLSFDGCSVKVLIHYYGGRFIVVPLSGEYSRRVWWECTFVLWYTGKRK